MYFDTREDQEDLFQEIVLQLWNSISSFKSESQFSTWMYRVAVNTAIVYFKKEKKQRSINENIENTDSIAQVDDQTRSDRADIFYQCVQSLNKIEKALIFLFLEGLSGEEIAKNLGITHSNVRVKLNRTKQKLQTIIKSKGYEF